MKEIFTYRKGVQYGTGGAGELVTELLRHKYFELKTDEKGNIVISVHNNDKSDEGNIYHNI